jgi:hypothetical protein
VAGRNDWIVFCLSLKRSLRKSETQNNNEFHFRKRNQSPLFIALFPLVASFNIPIIRDFAMRSQCFKRVVSSWYGISSLRGRRSVSGFKLVGDSLVHYAGARTHKIIHIDLVVGNDPFVPLVKFDVAIG